MNRRDGLTYHQIHPAKLATDWAFGLVSLIPFWNHQLLLGLILACIPSAIASHMLISYVDLNRYKYSAFGHYMSAHMNGWLQTVRLGGFFLMTLGAWQHDVLIIALGLALILLAWLNGIFARAIAAHSRAAAKMLHWHLRSIPANLPR